MSDMKFILPVPETITIAGQDADKLLGSGSGLAALLYLFILKTHGQSTMSEAASALGKTDGEIAEASEVLSKLGLIGCVGRTSGAPPHAAPDVTGVHSAPRTPDVTGVYSAPRTPDVTGVHSAPRTPDVTGIQLSAPRALAEPRKYTISEVREELNNGVDFPAIVDTAQRNLGKLLSPDELIRLYGIYNGLKLPSEVIFQLITHCIVECRMKGERIPTMRYIEKAAYTWEREGIFTLEHAEKYIKELERQRRAGHEIKRALQIRDRGFSASEQRFVDGWIAMGFGAEAVGIAYDRTILKTGKLTWQYMDSILKSWHDKGLHNPSDILEKDGKAKKFEAKAVPRERAAPNQEDYEQMRKFLNRLREEE